MSRVLATINVLLATTLLAWPPALFLAIFLFDAPGSTEDPVLLAFGAALVAYPAAILVGVTMFWVTRKSASRHALNWTLLGCVSPVSVLVLGMLNFLR